MKDKWLKNWMDAKKEFESLTGKKKPSESFLKVFRKSSGVESALEACDKGLDGLEKNWAQGRQKREKSQQDMRKVIDALKKTAAEYTKLLDGAIDKEIQDKNEKTVYYRGLKMLKAKLAQYQDSYEESLAFDLAQVSKDEQYADKHWKIVQQKLKAAVSKATASAKTIAAEVAKNGAKAWPEFITEIGSGIGEISLALGHVTQARKHGVDLADPEPIGKALSQLQGKLPNRPGVFNDQQMLACSKVLEEIIKAVKQNYNV